MTTLNHTHDATARSWLASANATDGDFPIQNLPFAVFHRAGSTEPMRGGVAIGDQVIDLAALSAARLLDGAALAAARSCSEPALNDFFARGPAAWRTLRHALFALLKDDTAQAHREALRDCLVPQAEAAFGLPARIGYQ